MNRFFSILIAMVLACGAQLMGADWPQWRGPDRNGHVPAGVAVPTSLEVHSIVWQIPIGDGVASPVVSGGKVFYLDNQQAKETVHGVDATSGKELWSATLDDVTHDTQSVPGPRCTPLADGDRVYAQSCRGKLQCLSAADGKLIWESNYVHDFNAIFIGEKGKAQGASRHGYAGSPLIDGDHLIVEAGGPHGASVVCFDKLTGKVIWKSGDAMPGYAAPIIATIAGTKQIVAFMADEVIGLDAGDGKPLWQVPVKTALGRHVTTPVVVGDMVCVASHQAGLIGIKVTYASGEFKAEQAWVDKRSAINFSSPVAVGDFLYGAGPSKNLICVDIRTGKQMWSKEDYFASTSAGSVHAGLIVMDKNILVLTDKGELVMIAADSSECHEIGRAQVAAVNWCNPAYVDGKLFLRDAHNLLCVALMR
jgi:outer membrane protein assembly factor BamB